MFRLSLKIQPSIWGFPYKLSSLLIWNTLFFWYYMTTAWTYEKAGLLKKVYRAANPCPFGCTNSCTPSKCPHSLSVRLQRGLSNTSIGKTYINEGLQTTRKHSSNSYQNKRAYLSSMIFIFSTFYLLNHTLSEPIPQLVLVHCWVPFLLIQVGRYKVVHFLSQILISWLNKIA